MTGLQRLCRLYGRLQVGDTLWLWDYAQEYPVTAADMPAGRARHAASERARWQAVREALEHREGRQKETDHAP